MNKIFLLVIFLSGVLAVYPQKLVWLNSPAGLIQSININSSGYAAILSGIKPGFGCAYDAASGYIYYTDMINRVIKKVNIDGSADQVVVSQSAGQISIPRGIALNVTGHRIYWSDNGTGKIKKSDLAGTNAADVVSGLNSPSFVAYDNVHSMLYWVDNGTGTKKIQRCDTLSGNIQDFVTGLTSVWGIGLDLVNGYLYWIDQGVDKLQRKLLTDLNPADKSDVITGLSGNQRGLAVDPLDNRIFWASVLPPSSSQIKMANLDGSSVASLVSSLNYPQGIALDWNAALPVELSSFVTIPQGRNILLNWSTQTEKNSYKFIVDRKTMNIDWETVGSVNAAGLSNSPKQYSFVDKNLQTGKYLYRLKMIDADGNFEFSNIVESDVALPSDFELSQNYPNPFNPSTRINYNLPSQSLVQLNLFDALGKKKIALVNEVQDPGFYSYTVDSKSWNLSSGVYFYRLTAVNSSSNFSEIKKMVLLK